MRPSAQLADGRPRVPRQLRGREELVGAEDRLALADEHGPAADRTSVPAHAGLSRKRSVTVVPTGASAASRCAAVPRAREDGAAGGIAVLPFCACPVTGPVRSTFGVVGGSGERPPRPRRRQRGVAGPHAGVKSEIRSASGASLSPSAAAARSRARCRTSAASGHAASRRRRCPCSSAPAAADGGGRRPAAAPGRAAVREREEVAVDAGGGRVADAALHRRHAILAEDRAVREHRLQAVRAAGPRRVEDVHRDRAVRGTAPAARRSRPA